MIVAAVPKCPEARVELNEPSMQTPFPSTTIFKIQLHQFLSYCCHCSHWLLSLLSLKSLLSSIRTYLQTMVLSRVLLFCVSYCYCYPRIQLLLLPKYKNCSYFFFFFARFLSTRLSSTPPSISENSDKAVLSFLKIVNLYLFHFVHFVFFALGGKNEATCNWIFKQVLWTTLS